MNKQDFLSVLQRVGKQDLHIPESERLAIPHKPILSTCLKEIAEDAETYRGTVIAALPYSLFKLFHETGDRMLYEQSPDRGYFLRRHRLATYAATAWLYQREDDIHELEDIIWAICDEYTWSLTAHLRPESFTTKLEYGAYMVDLFAAETAQALAEIVMLMGDKLDEIIRRRIAFLLEERVFKRVLEDDRFFWMHATHNWAAVCAGSVGMAAIYAVDDEEHLADILARITPALDSFLSGFAQDGSCLEGIGYWTYGFSYFTSFADLLLRRTAGEIDLFKDPRVPLIAEFQQKCFFPGGRAVGFSDGDSHTTYLPGLTYYLSRKFPNVTVPPYSCCAKGFHGDHCYRWSNILRNLIWTPADAPNEQESYQSYQLPSAQWYIGHSANGAGVAVKAGHNDEPHNHNDVGSFQFYMNSEDLLCELGPGKYTRQYFSDERYTILTCGSQGHNLPMIDGHTQLAGKQACAQNVQLNPQGISMDIAPAYHLDFLPHLQRAVTFDEATGRMTLNDTFHLEGSHEICERFMTFGSITQGDGCLSFSLNGQQLDLLYDASQWTVKLVPLQYESHLNGTYYVTAADFIAQVADKYTASFQVVPRI